MGGIVLILYGSSRSLEVSAALLFIWGVGAAVFINYAVVLLQIYTEPAMLGRVMSMYTLVFLAASPVGYLLAGGWAAAAIGIAAIAFLRPVRNLE
jgi:hypothetical protein